MTQEATTITTNLEKLVKITGRAKAAKFLGVSLPTLDANRSGKTIMKADKYLILLNALQKLTEAGLA